VDIFDAPLPPPGPDPPPGRSLAENVAGGVVVFGLPLVYLCILIATDLTKRPDQALLWGPACFGLAGAVVCVLARLGLGRSIYAVAACLWWCLLAGLSLVVIDILIFPF
jgi:hypothetical protein